MGGSHLGPLANQPQRVKDDFKSAAELFLKGAGAVGVAKNVYGGIKQITEFVTDPLAWLGKFISEKAYANLKKYGEVYIKKAIGERVGTLRIGCHSLLAKDCGPELFFDGGMECARAAHPKSIMSSDSLLTLADEYRPTFEKPENDPAAPADAAHFTWETIADANFPVVGLDIEEKKRRINSILKHDTKGFVVGDGVNYAFRPDLPLTIPYQRVEVKTVLARDVDRRWWYPVLMDREHHKTVANWFGPDGSFSLRAPEYVHRLRYLKPEEHKKFVDEADKLRAQLQDQYNALKSVKK